MSWGEALITIIVMSVIGAGAGAGMYRHLERTEGEIRRADLEYRTIAKQLGVDPEDVFTMGIHCAAYGATRDDLDKVMREWGSAMTADIRTAAQREAHLVQRRWCVKLTRYDGSESVIAVYASRAEAVADATRRNADYQAETYYVEEWR